MIGISTGYKIRLHSLCYVLVISPDTPREILLGVEPGVEVARALWLLYR